MRARSVLCFALVAIFPAIAVAWQKGDTAPVLIREVPPEYEAELANAYLLDHVAVEFIVDAAGVPVALSSKTRLPDNVVEAIMQWRFRPGKKDGRETAFSMLMTLALRRPIAPDVERVYRRRWYATSKELADALKAGESLDAPGAGQLLAAIDQGGQNLNACATLLGYWNAQSEGGEDTIKARANQIAWLAEFAPESDLAGSPFARINAGAGRLQDSAGYSRVREIWLRQAGLNAGNPAILEHAVNFLEVADGEKAEQLLLPVVAKHMDEAAAWLGEVYGLAAVGVADVDLKTGLPSEAAGRNAPFSQNARQALLTTKDPRITVFGLSTVIRHGRALAKLGHLPASYAEFCSALLDRAKQIQPAISSSCDTSLPQPDERSPVTRIRVGGQVQQARRIKQIAPQYPQEAKTRGVAGTVRLQAIIGKDGKIRVLDLISGPLALYESARDAVRQWVYSPTLLNGQPIEVDTIIDVNYELRR